MDFSLIAIAPKEAFNVQAAMDAINDALEAEVLLAVEDFRTTVETWDGSQVFYSTNPHAQGNGIAIEVGTDDKVYSILTKGSLAHMITPKNGKFLAFQTGFTAKTTPGVLQSHAGGKSGDTAFAKAVIHPGTEPRNYDLLVRDKRQAEGTLQAAVDAAMKKILP